ncbi:UvrD-helicase domain-containing protein [Methanohalophilus sp.]
MIEKETGFRNILSTPLLYFLSRRIKKYNGDVNRGFIKKRLDEFELFFNGENGEFTYPLNEDQRLAIVRDDNHNLVTAGAGSGKTTVLVARMIYLVKRNDSVDPEQIMALAFGKDVVKEMTVEIKEKTGMTGFKIKTFHSYCNSLLKDEVVDIAKGEKKVFGRDVTPVIKNCFEKCMENTEFQEKVGLFLERFYDSEVSEASFETKEKYYQYLRKLKYTTLNNIEVKSLSEKEIANFFFRHNIEFEYEKKAEWSDAKGKGYHPDFYLPALDMYIEHLGIDEKGHVPDWFNLSSKEYQEKIKWSREQFKKYGKSFIETRDYERISGDLIPNLLYELRKYNPSIASESLTYKELVNKTFACRGDKNAFIKLIIYFINNGKTNGFESKDIKIRLTGEYCTQRQQLFGEIATSVWREYEHYLQENRYYDYDDMLNEAYRLIKANPQKYAKNLKHILVDEFQDVSKQRVRILQALIEGNPEIKLFCVGDDWQSIYGFAGSKVEYFTDYENFFPYHQKTNLKMNYRCCPQIVSASCNLIKNNSKYNEKEVESFEKEDGNLFKVIFDNEEKFINKQASFIWYKVNELLSKGVEPGEIMILSRFNYIFDPLIGHLYSQMNGFTKDVLKELRIIERDSGLCFSEPISIIKSNAYTISETFKKFGKVNNEWVNIEREFVKLKELCERNDVDGVIIEKISNMSDHFIKQLRLYYDIRFLSVHKSKGTEAKYVFLMNVIDDRYGFPPQIRDDPVLYVAKADSAEHIRKLENQQDIEKLEEERRLFYVALTRAKKTIYICTLQDNESIFLQEINDYTKIYDRSRS